ncbi:MAG: hypothetical protein Fues2KO_26990 [Fuerstiella sp.]
MRMLLLSVGFVLGSISAITSPPAVAQQNAGEAKSPPREQAAQRADTDSAAQLLPPSTVLYVEFPDPPALISTIFDHPLRARIEALDVWQQATKQVGYRNFLAGRKFVELQLGMDWRTALDKLLANGIYLGVDAQTEGVALLIRSQDADALNLFRTKLLELTKLGRTPDQIREAEYRGQTVYDTGDAKFAVVNDWLLMTNRPETGKAVMDRLLGDRLESLAEEPTFVSALQSKAVESTGWGFVNLKSLRDAGIAKQLFAGQSENPGIELLFGGILSTLQKTPFATASLTTADDRFGLQFSIPHQQDWVPEERQFFFGPEGNGTAPAIPAVQNPLLTVAAYRDISEMWLRAGDLFDERTNDQLAEADASLTTLFAGREFGEEILGTLTPQVGFVATQQDFTDILPAPAIRLPQFALVLELREPESMTRELRRTFQSMVGFFNVVGAMEGNPQLEMEMEKTDRYELVTTAYVPEQDDAQSTQAGLVYNFSPSVGFAGKRFIVSSTDRLARELVQAPLANDRPQGSPVNSQAELQADVLQHVLADNREQLIAQNMLEEGRSREEAEAAIDLLLQFVGYFDQASLKLKTAADELSLQLEVRIDDVQQATP